ncbi:MAG: imidazole glycerol phosphate synthase subunit HisH [Candidatus Dadabacteria bacterium]|nr:imidazole glycerol phosphate synthase subunit HisH [Candidatus Dadabacteria bacterium]NIS08962.1 imidazole glycerol phosphate synthase subunit HisH [Candidatus Dadabacteria bacterium]NIV40777.1 imidazole glycerol phosphate synthase subunit HisH [Candidatus Dadabacteria bacterium]NIY22269.1 imidazole glycerol phosphate synthase subunit HisH [Candidatus Dadabacteria bacterium]
MIAIVDYGMGNLRSVNKAFESQGCMSVVTNDAATLMNSHGLVLPGVGAFGDCIKNLQQYKLFDLILEYIRTGKPYLGICLGYQILFESSEESPNQKGLGFIKGKVVKFNFEKELNLKVPHMGWNQINIKKQSELLDGIADKNWFYFVHSYYPVPADSGIVAITTDYGIEFTAAIEKDNVFACQFHPEKSSDPGLKIIKNFARKCGQIIEEKAV